MPSFPHSYSFDPSYGYNLETLLQITPPPAPADYASFWQSRYERLATLPVRIEVSVVQPYNAGFQVQIVRFESTEGFWIGAWLLTPLNLPVRAGLVVGHGYGGRDGPDVFLPRADAAYLFPCFRGMSLSKRAGVSDNPAFHVLHDIDKPTRYLLGGCVEDVWMAVAALLSIFPEVAGHIGYQGTSFGGGIGAMALPWDGRIQKAALNVPTFGHQALRLQLPTIGSGEAVRAFERRHGHVLETLQYYDAALAAQYVHQAVHVAAALFDPAVAPPGQFAIYNSLAGPKQLFVLEAGHFEYSKQTEQEHELQAELIEFFAKL